MNNARVSFLPASLTRIAWVWTVLFWLGLVAVPVGAVLVRAGGSETLLDPVILAVAWATASQALLSAALAAMIGLPLGLWVGSRSSRGSRWAEQLLELPFGVPTVVAAVAWILWLGRSGWLAQLGLRLDLAYSFTAVVLAHVFFNAPWIALQVAQARRQLPQSLIEASRLLGAGRWQEFESVSWPQVRAAFLSATAQAQVFCSMSFALVLILGGGPPVQTLETALYSRIRYGTLDLSGAVACAVWQLFLTLLPWFGVLWLQARSGLRERERSLRAREVAPSFNPLMVALSAFFVLPYFGVFFGESSLLPLGRPEVAGEAWEALKISAAIAASVGVGTLLCAGFAVVAVTGLPERREKTRLWVSALLGLPSGISALVLGLGVWLAYGRWIDPFEGSFAAIMALQITLFFPLVFRIFWPVAQRSQTGLLEAAVSLGAGPWLAFRVVEWPRWKPAVFSATAIVTGASLGEVAAVSLFYSENLIPLPLLISRWSAQYRFADAQAIAALLLLLSTGAIAAVSAARHQKGKF